MQWNIDSDQMRQLVGIVRNLPGFGNSQDRKVTVATALGLSERAKDAIGTLFFEGSDDVVAGNVIMKLSSLGPLEDGKHPLALFLTHAVYPKVDEDKQRQLDELMEKCFKPILANSNSQNSPQRPPIKSLSLKWIWAIGVIILAISMVVWMTLFQARENGPESSRRATSKNKQTLPSFVSQGSNEPGQLWDVRIQDCGIGFRWCPPGRFMMGSSKVEADRDDDEDQVEVILSKGFWMSETEVTQGLWQALGGKLLDWSDFGGTANLPVYNVSHEEAEAFTGKLSQKLHESGQLPSGMSVVLPTEAQWEYGARSGTTSRFSFGDDEDKVSKYAWFAGNSDRKVHPVGTKAPNNWGLRDMSGNVWEWCADRYDKKLSGGTDPCGPSNGFLRVIRGGSWDLNSEVFRTANRSFNKPGYRFNFVGFRIAVVNK